MANGLLAKYPASFWRMCAGALLFFLSFNMVLPELPEHLRRIGGGQYLGWIIASFSMAALLARPLSGWVTDHLGRKWSMLGGSAFCVVAGLLYPLTMVVWMFFLVRIVHGFSTGFAPTGFTAFTSDVVPNEKRGEALGWQGIFSNIGASAGYALGAAIVAYIGVDGMFFTSSIMAIAAIWLFSGLPETKLPKSSHPKGKQAIFSKKWLPPAFIMFSVCAPLGAVLTIMPDYTLSLGFVNKGLFLSVYIGFSLLVRLFSGRLSDRIGRPISSAIGSICQLIAFSLLILYPDTTFFFISAGFYGLGQGFNAPALFAWAGDLSHSHNRGRAMGMLFIAIELGIILGSFASGYFLNLQPNHYSGIFIMNFVFAAIALVLSIYYHKKNGAPSPVSIQ